MLIHRRSFGRLCKPAKRQQSSPTSVTQGVLADGIQILFMSVNRPGSRICTMILYQLLEATHSGPAATPHTRSFRPPSARSLMAAKPSTSLLTLTSTATSRMPVRNILNEFIRLFESIQLQAGKRCGSTGRSRSVSLGLTRQSPILS